MSTLMSPTLTERNPSERPVTKSAKANAKLKLAQQEFRRIVTVNIGGAGGHREAEDATHNLMTRQPAFWSDAQYHNAPAGSLLYYANHFAGVERGIAAYHNDFPPSSYDIGEARFLDTLIPLNEAAVASLQEAYELTGTFRSKAELIKRAPSTASIGELVSGREA